jgi:hypothetical protein
VLKASRFRALTPALASSSGPAPLRCTDSDKVLKEASSPPSALRALVRQKPYTLLHVT